MKRVFLCLSMLIFLFVGCNQTTESDQNEQDVHSEEDVSSEVSEDEMASEELNHDVSKQNGLVLSCRVGIYRQQCVMVLHCTNNGNYYDADVEGEYFYAKHQKKLDLEGTYEAETSTYYLTESYKGKKSGMMGFIAGIDSDMNHWRADEDSRDQHFSSEILFEFDPTEEEVRFRHERYETEHQVDYNPETEDPKTATDELNISWINDQYLAFDYHVVNFSQNLGSVDGIAKVQDDGTAIWEDEKGFKLTFEFKKDKATVTPENYEEMTYGGFGVTFGGTYTKI